MITTVTLNPAVDRMCQIHEMKMGDVNKLRSSIDYAGGKGINVAKILRQFRLPVAVMGFVGGSAGHLISDTCERLQMDCRLQEISGNTRTNTNIVSDDGLVTEILEPGPDITEKEYGKFLELFDDTLTQSELVVLSGSIPRGIPQGVYADLIKRCNAAGCPVFLDSSGEALREGIKACPTFVKPNQKELEYLVGHPLATREAVLEAAREIVKSGVENVVISMGAEGMLYVNEEGDAFREAVKVKVQNTVGCGDTSVASFVMSYLSGDDRELALRKAVALAGANALTNEAAFVDMNAYLDLL